MATTQRAGDYYAWSPQKLVSATLHEGQISMTQHLLAAYAEDIQIRQSGLEPDKHEGYRTHAEANPASMEALR